MSRTHPAETEIPAVLAGVMERAKGSMHPAFLHKPTEAQPQTFPYFLAHAFSFR